MNIKQLTNFKKEYFSACGIKDDGGRLRPLVNHRKAFSVVATRYSTTKEVGKVLGRDHSNITYYTQNHSANMMNADYRLAFENAEIVVKNHALKSPQQTLASLSEDKLKLTLENIELKKEVASLYVYKMKYQKIFKTMNDVR